MTNDMKVEYLSPEVISVDFSDFEGLLCASTGELPPLEESDDMSNLGWN